MANDRTILITGVTGNQGGAVAQAPQGSGFHLRGLTRKPDSERAAALASQGIDIVKGDLDDTRDRQNRIVQEGTVFQGVWPCQKRNTLHMKLSDPFSRLL